MDGRRNQHRDRSESESSSGSSVDQSRLRLRPWLEDQINKGEIPGLFWEDHVKKIARVPWKRSGTQAWLPRDSKLFELWAKHTGRYEADIKKPDCYATWKTRLRCAFYKDPEIEHLSNLDDKKCAEPYRVYQLKGGSKVCHPDVTSTTDGGKVLAQPQSHITTYQEPTSTTGNLLPKTVEEQEPISTTSEESTSSLQRILDEMNPGGFSNISLENNITEQPLHEARNEPMEVGEGATCSDQAIANPLPTRQCPQDAIQICNPQTGQTSFSQINLPKDFEMYIQIKYKALVVKEEHVSNQIGCRLFYEKPGSFKQQIVASKTSAEDMVKLYGDAKIQQVLFPPHDDFIADASQKDITGQLLEHICRGVILECKEGNIFATRLCRCVVFVVSDHFDGKLERSQKVKVFDFQEFMNSVQRCNDQNNIKKPSCDVHVGFGQKWNLRQSSDTVLITARVLNRKAHDILQWMKLLSERFASIGSIPAISIANDGDQHIENIMRACAASMHWANLQN